jgi:hypothetical protein
MPGRKPMGPKLVQNLDGSEQAKERLEVILETIAERQTIEGACEYLGISEARFFQLRTQVLEAGLTCLEPRPLGRPPKTSSPEQERIEELEEILRDKDSELQATEVRLELAQIMPRLVQDEELKKTPKHKQRRRRLIWRKRRRRK